MDSSPALLESPTGGNCQPSHLASMIIARANVVVIIFIGCTDSTLMITRHLYSHQVGCLNWKDAFSREADDGLALDGRGLRA